MRLYEYAEDFARLFDDLDAIADYVPDQNEDGQYIDADGNIIDDLTAYKSDMQTAWFDTLDGIEGEFELKAENVACFILQLDGELEMLKKRETAFKRRKKAKENEIKWLKSYLLSCMQQVGRTEIKSPDVKISIRNNAESVQLDDEEQFIRLCLARGKDDYLRYKDPELNRTAIKKALQAGEEIDGAHLIRTQSLIIK